MAKSTQILILLITIYSTVVIYGFYLVKNQQPKTLNETNSEVVAEPPTQAVSHIRQRLNIKTIPLF
ncbi:hypothetical protein Q8W40_06795 [Vibrio penaeicida]|uniref:hypothetical protein n=1 Tax=Vibrio penaeicida TaxID=104609 RepID=UPI002736FA15|nr:hypothetical protein [Vibrio penaeicida]MDP2571879.1 hypothetical protein [Vibrio penaeicida]